MIKSTKEMKAEFWAMSQTELQSLISRNEGYQNGVFAKLGNLPQKPFHSQLVDLAIACTRYDERVRIERAKAAIKRRCPHRSRARVSAKSAVA